MQSSGHTLTLEPSSFEHQSGGPATRLMVVPPSRAARHCRVETPIRWQKPLRPVRQPPLSRPVLRTRGCARQPAGRPTPLDPTEWHPAVWPGQPASGSGRPRTLEKRRGDAPPIQNTTPPVRVRARARHRPARSKLPVHQAIPSAGSRSVVLRRCLVVLPGGLGADHRQVPARIRTGCRGTFRSPHILPNLGSPEDRSLDTNRTFRTQSSRRR